MRRLFGLLLGLMLFVRPAWAQPAAPAAPEPLGHVLYTELSPVSLGIRVFSEDDDVAGVLGESYGLFYEHRLPGALRLRAGGVFYSKTPLLDGYHLRFVSPSVGLGASLGAWNERLPFSRRIVGRRTLTVFADVLHARVDGSYECFFDCPERREERSFSGRRTMMSLGLISHTVFTGSGVVLNYTMGVLVTPDVDGRHTSVTPRFAFGFGFNRTAR